MSIETIIFISLGGGLLIWAVVSYNTFVAARNRYENAFSQIDVQLKRRYDLIPNLVNATSASLRHERETLEAVVSARRQAMSAEQSAKRDPGSENALMALAAAESTLGSSLGRLMALVEDYPELQGDEAVNRLTEELSSTENRLAFARQAFNDQITSYNTAIETLPASLIAGVAGFRRAAQLNSTSRREEREPVAVAL